MPLLAFLNFYFKQLFPGPTFRFLILRVMIWLWKREVDHSSLLHHYLVEFFLYLLDFRMVFNVTNRIIVFVLWQTAGKLRLFSRWHYLFLVVNLACRCIFEALSGSWSILWFFLWLFTYLMKSRLVISLNLHSLRVSWRRKALFESGLLLFLLSQWLRH